MDRLATMLTIALAALVRVRGFSKGVMVEEIRVDLTPIPAASPASRLPAASGLRSERVLGLLLTLEALRAAPVLLNPPKV